MFKENPYNNPFNRFRQTWVYEILITIFSVIIIFIQALYYGPTHCKNANKDEFYSHVLTVHE